MKLGTGTIGTVIFVAIGTAAFVWMAKRPAVDATAMQFGMVNTEANNEAQVDSASTNTPANIKDEPTTSSDDQNSVTESTTSETTNTSAPADDNASVETKGSTDEETAKDVVKKEETNDNTAVESNDSPDVAPKEPESVTSDKPEMAKPVIEKSVPVVPAMPIMPDMPTGKPVELHAPISTSTIEEVKTPESDSAAEVVEPSSESSTTVTEPAVSESVVSPDNVPTGLNIESNAPTQMEKPTETVTPSQDSGSGIGTEPVTQSSADQEKTSSENTSADTSVDSSSSTSVQKEDGVASDPDKKRLPKTITIRTDEIFGKSLPADLTNQLPETIEIPVDLLFDRSASEE